MYNYRMKDIFKLLKVANDTIESKFVQNMLSSSFADIGIDSDEGDEEDLESAFQEIIEDVHSLNHIGAIVFWILNAKVSDQKKNWICRIFLPCIARVKLVR